MQYTELEKKVYALHVQENSITLLLWRKDPLRKSKQNKLGVFLIWKKNASARWGGFGWKENSLK